MKIKDMLKDSRPRERLVKFGVENLSDAELLALILEKGTKQENVIDMSSRLISKYDLDKLSDCSLKELQEINGIGFAKACQILALFEFNKRRNLAKRPIKYIKTAEDVFNHLYECLKDEKQERFIVLMLNSKNILINEEVIFVGTSESSLAHPKEIFRSAIKNSANRVIIVHNHPSGDPTPSDVDLKLTEKLIEVGELLGIIVLDHIIIGNGKWWSWRENPSPIV